MIRKIPASAGSNESGGFQTPAPVGGWNTRDPEAAMPPQDAIYLDNFFPYASGVMLRKGWQAHGSVPALVLPAVQAIEALMSYSPSLGDKKLFAGCTDGIYNVTAAGVGTLSSAATNARWKSVNISTAGGNFLWCCNGVDKARVFNGAAWIVLDGASAPPLTGVVSTDITNVSLHQTRLYLTVKEKLSFFYLPVNAIAGAAVEFPLGALFRRGGYTVATFSWTIDAGAGMDDHFVVVSSEGEMAVYAGYDPSNAATWTLVGVYYVGRPLGPNCFVRLGGETVLLTVQGAIPLAKLVQSSSIDRRLFITDKIGNFFSTVVDQFGDNYGWQATVYPEAQLMLINVPIRSGLSWQFAMNIMTGAWCRFTELNATSWVLHDGELYFSVGTAVRKGWMGQRDGEAAIIGRAKTAFQYINRAGKINQITLLRPIFQAGGPVTASLALDTDFRNGTSMAGSISFIQQIAIWDSSLWNEAFWSGSLTVSQWRTVSHVPGRAFSLRLRVSLKDISFSWSATDFIGKQGGLM